jgi:endonuclease YncB( thermonuclease family)
MYEYAGTVRAVVDGDTIDVDLDLGCSVFIRTRLRLRHINAPEHGTPEGDAATEYLKYLLPKSCAVVVTTHKDQKEKFGRYLADVVRGQTDINARMVEKGHATPYEGGKR